MQRDPRCIARPLTGYVFYSNFGFTPFRSADTPWTRETLIANVRDELDVPALDVWVEPFQPLGQESTVVQWAAYVKNAHSGKVNAMHQELELAIRALSLQVWGDDLTGA